MGPGRGRGRGDGGRFGRGMLIILDFPLIITWKGIVSEQVWPRLEGSRLTSSMSLPLEAGLLSFLRSDALSDVKMCVPILTIKDLFVTCQAGGD